MKNEIILADKIWFLITLFIAFVIFWQSNGPALVSDNRFYVLQFDKIVHFSVWVSLSFSLRLGSNSIIINTTVRNRKLILILLIAICTLYGITDEIHQLFIPSRSSDVFDVLADSLGSIVGVLTGDYLVRRTELTGKDNKII